MERRKKGFAGRARSVLGVGFVALVMSLFNSMNVAHADSKITLNLKEADIQTVIATVSEFTGKNFIIDPRVKGKVTIISSKPMNRAEVYQAFLSLLEVHKYAAVPAGKLIKIVPDVNAKQSSTPVVSAAHPGKGDEMVTRVIEIENVSAAQLVPILRPLVPQQGHLAAYAPSNILILSDRAANVERLLKIIKRVDVASANDIEVIPLKHASAAEVVRILETLQRQEKRDAKSANAGPVLVADERTNSLLLSGDKAQRLNIRALVSHLDTPLESTGNTKVIYLRYAEAKDLVPVLTGLGKSVEKEKKKSIKGGSAAVSTLNIQAHDATNALVITAAPDVMRSLEGVIRQLDVRRAQVLVEAVIAEISEDRLGQLGVQWLFDGTPGGNGPIGGVSYGSNNILSLAATATTGGVPNIAEGVFMGLGRFDSPNVNFAMLVTALEGDGDTNILSKPTIVTLDNEEAEIVVGQNVPFITGSYSSVGSSSTPTNPFQTIQRENVGITLKVKPQINEGNAIKLDIEQKTDSINRSATGAADLITNTRSIRTSVLVDDGGSVVLGGLISEDLQVQEQRVPGLGSLPIIGGLFRYQQTKKLKSNLMVFLHPVILRDAAVTTRITGSKYEYIRAQQMGVRERGVALMDDEAAPVMPTFDEFMQLPPPFEASRGEGDAQSPADVANTR